MAAPKSKQLGYGKLLDAWVAPDGAGDPMGCLATSFTFSPTFFEEECLGRFLGLETDPVEDGPLYLVEREEKLAQLILAAALIDQHHCQGSRSLRWDLLPVRLSNGILHAKVSLLHWSRLIRVIVASANLTEDGYRRNQEVFGVLDYHPDSQAPLPALREIVTFLRDILDLNLTTPEMASPVLARGNIFLDRVLGSTPDWGTEIIPSGRQGVRLYPVLVGPGRSSVFAQLAELWPGGGPPIQARVVSPFFDFSDKDNQPAMALWLLLRRRGKAIISYHVTAEDVPGKDEIMVHAPETLKSAEPNGRNEVATNFYRLDLEVNRPLHAKAIWLEDNRWKSYLIGSSNFTSAGMGISSSAVNVEANLVYSVDAQLNRKAADMLEHSFLGGKLVKKFRWKPHPDEGEDSPGEAVALPSAFGAAIFEISGQQDAFIRLSFNATPPVGWSMLLERDERPFYGENEWTAQGKPNQFTVAWQENRPPSGFWVSWDKAPGRSWWPVNVASSDCLPPPEELKDLPLEVLIDILTSARPLHRVLGDYLKRKGIGTAKTKDGETIVVDPHKRVDTSQFLLQRTRRLSLALNFLRERLERPVTTPESLFWRLRGPIGVEALARAVVREARSEEEKAFLITELVLELSRVKPKSGPGCLPPNEIKQALHDLIPELRQLIPGGALDRVVNLQEYVDNVFIKVLS
jgi:hypothetical protein